MLPFAICLLTTSALAADYGNYMGMYSLPAQGYAGPSSLPMDYNDDIYNRDFLIKPNSHIIYNFEQTRRDQPPQVEQRDENVGLYMYNRPKSTTPEPIVPKLNDFQGVHQLPRLPSFNPPIQTYNNQHWNHMSAYPSTIPPPPPTPKWEDLTTLNQQTSRLQSQNWNTGSLPVQHEVPKQNLPTQYNHPAQSNLATQPPIYNQQKYYGFQPQYQKPASTPAPAPSLRWEEPISQEFNRKHSQPTPAIPSFPNAAPTSKPFGNSMTQSFGLQTVQKQVPPQAPQLSVNRGNHKFSWSDVAKEQPIQTTTKSSVGQQSRSPPPPVPTLSPWLDGFGK